MTNTIHGSPHVAVQVRDVRGGGAVHLHPPTPAPPVPRQLPARRMWVDRERILGYLDQAWEARQGPLWVGIEGPSGIGKTALAVQWAHRHTWADGCLYADLARTRPATVLRGWLHALGHQHLPDAPGQVEALWRTATADRQIFALVDNTTPGDAAALLPAGPECAGIATAHAHLWGLVAHGGRCVRLPPLSPDATSALIHGLLDTPLPSPVLEAAVATTAGLPLAATLTATYLAEHHQPRFAPEEEPVDTHLTRLLDALPDTTAGAAVCLALHPGYLTLECAAALLNVVPGEAGRVLQTLTEASLLQRTDDSRWIIHDRVRPALAERVTPTVRTQGVARLARYYRLRSAALEAHLNTWRYRIDTEADRLALDTQQEQGTVWFPTKADALAWADAELNNLCVVVEMLEAENRPEAWQISDLQGTYINKRRPLELARRLYAASLRAAQAQDNPSAVGIIHRRLALVTENPAQKLEHAEAALEAYTTADHRAGIATGHEGLSDAHLDLGDIDTAVWHARESIRRHEQLDNPRGLSMQLRKLGQLLALQGNHEETLNLVVRAHRIQSGLRVPDQHQMARSAAALIDVALSRAGSEVQNLSPVERAALLITGQTGATLMRQDGALHREAQMREQVAGLTTDPDHEHDQLTTALALHEQLGQRPDADRVRSRLNGVAAKTPAE